MLVFKEVSLQGWLFVAHFGEIQMLLPVALCAILLLSRKEATRPLASGWLVSLMFAALLTTASKVAFIGWGIGLPDIDFTGISGHAMIAMAVYPLLFATLASQLAPMQQQFSVLTGFVLALLVGQSRLEINVHSVSEVVAGFMVGGAVSLTMLIKNSLPRAPASLLVMVSLSGFLGLCLLKTPQVNPHSWVTQLSLMLSGAITPHTRESVKKLQFPPLQH